MSREIARLQRKKMNQKQQEISDFKWTSFNSAQQTFLEGKAEGRLE